MHKGINTTVDEGQTPIITTGGGFDEKSTLAFPWQIGGTQQMNVNVDVRPTLIKNQTPAIAFALRGREGGAVPEIHADGTNVGALRAANGGSSRDYIQTSVSVRRLTPTECERLQGFPDGWTDVPYRGKPAPDGPRYKALGNSMAVPVMRWIGERIKLVDEKRPTT